MISWRKIHEWMVGALETPFFRAELHRAEVSLARSSDTGLRVIEGGKNGRGRKNPVEPPEQKRCAVVKG
ncbi:MAG: hypothetical protein K6T29_02015 [Peptococcaceae bacterium]|nr:hypothetical protein [Peptococcaceae bacterium]